MAQFGPAWHLRQDEVGLIIARTKGPRNTSAKRKRLSFKAFVQSFMQLCRPRSASGAICANYICQKRG